MTITTSRNSIAHGDIGLIGRSGRMLPRRCGGTLYGLIDGDTASNPVNDVQRDCERTSAILSRDDDGHPALYSRDKTFELTAQRLGAIAPQWNSLHDLCDALCGERHARQKLHAGAQTQKLPLTTREVEADVPGALEEANLPHPLERNTTCGQICHAATGELEARVRNVRTCGKDRDAHGCDRNDGLAHEAEHEIEVMDHQVEHHGYVRATGPERREPVALDEQRLLEIRLARAQRTIETFDMAD